MRIKRVLKVRDDFYQKNLHVGMEEKDFSGTLTIVNLSYQNEFGSFILCEHQTDAYEEDHWERRKGVAPSSDHIYEVVGTIHIPGYRNRFGGIGFFVKNHQENEVLGLSYQQAWNLVFHQGARNVEASSSHFHPFHTKLMDSIEGLPSLDSHYWKIPAYDSEGKAFAPLTKEALRQLENGMGNAVDGLVREQRPIFDNEDLSHLNEVSTLLKTSRKIAVLSGAGLSTHSGIPDYRSSAKSMWRKNPHVLDHLNQETFENEPEMFWKAIYELIKESLSAVTPFPTREALLATLQSLKPNAGHRFLAKLPKDVTMITQNVDRLCQKAGAQRVIEMHGNILECHCMECNKMYPLVDLLKKEEMPTCECGFVLRPNVVFFGDEVRNFQESVETIESADLILIVGTTLQVYPFNQLLRYKNKRSRVVVINGAPLDKKFGVDYALIGDISKIFNQLDGGTRGQAPCPRE